MSNQPEKLKHGYFVGGGFYTLVYVVEGVEVGASSPVDMDGLGIIFDDLEHETRASFLDPEPLESFLLPFEFLE